MTTPQILLAILAVSLAIGCAIFLYLIWITPEPECAEICPAETYAAVAQAAAGIPSLPAESTPRRPWFAFRDLENLAADLMQPTGTRGEYGYCSHPALPAFPENTNHHMLLEAIGLAAAFVCMESDCKNEALMDQVWDGGSCLEWIPTTPAGEGWNLLEIYSTEDGPYALFARPLCRAEQQERMQMGQFNASTVAGYRNVLTALAKDLDALAAFAEDAMHPPASFADRAARRAVRAITHLHKEIELLKSEASQRTA